MSARAVLHGGRLDGLEQYVPAGPDGLPHAVLLAPGDPLPGPHEGPRLVSILRYRRVRLEVVLDGVDLWRYELVPPITLHTSEED